MSLQMSQVKKFGEDLFELILDEVVEMKPQSNQRPAINKYGNYQTPKKTYSARKVIYNTLIQKYNGEILTCPLLLEVDFYFERPKSVKRKLHTVKPDCTNLGKLVEDFQNKKPFIWHDDCQFVSVKFQKFYSPENRIVIRLYREKNEL